MYVFRGVNVNDLYSGACQLLRDRPEVSHSRDSRYGPVIEFNEPVTSVYERPWECALLDAGRNINPFFHFMEALWILAGRNDVEFVARYAKKMREFSDDGEVFHGAYGFRWREHFTHESSVDLESAAVGRAGASSIIDQLETVCQMLKTDPEDRRAVLTMWDPPLDLGRKGKDFPCNTHVYLKVRHGRLIATVCCRSNDMVWGAYGTNATQFGFLMAYVAARVGVPIGPLTQVSDSLHVYENVWKDLPRPAAVVPYPGTVPLCDVPENFLRECEAFCADEEGTSYQNWIFLSTAMPMRSAWDKWKDGRHSAALEEAQNIQAPDWRAACVAWLERAIAKKGAGV